MSQHFYAHKLCVYVCVCVCGVCVCARVCVLYKTYARGGTALIAIDSELKITPGYDYFATYVLLI